LVQFGRSATRRGGGHQHENMTQTLAPRLAVGVRPYRPSDHNACRRLWGELVEQHWEFYGSPPDAGDPGAGFEEYLTRLDLAGMWVADDNGVVGLIGLVLGGSGGAVDPVVVTGRRRGEGIGRALLSHVATQAHMRGLRELTISPAWRNAEAIHCLHAAGFDVLTHVTLAMRLDDHAFRAGPELHERSFRS
jgi:GNAT superfamily N-acetyltransferase